MALTPLLTPKLDLFLVSTLQLAFGRDLGLPSQLSATQGIMCCLSYTRMVVPLAHNQQEVSSVTFLSWGWFVLSHPHWPAANV